MDFDKEFKDALQALPSKEKDKLIIKFLKKDLKFANALQFKLLANASVEEKRKETQKRIEVLVARASDSFYSPGDFLMSLRSISGVINDHVYLTKDKYGDITLNLLMLRRALERKSTDIDSYTARRAHTLCIYIVARLFKILLLIQKQHEDLHIEFQDDLEKIGDLMGESENVMSVAIKNGFDVNWLKSMNIPDDLPAFHKELRKKGFLK